MLKTKTAYRVGVVACTAAAVAAVSAPGIAAADEYAGQTYADASSMLRARGQTVTIVAVVGNKMPTDQCVVTSSQRAPFVRDQGGDFTRAATEVLLTLNCNAAAASDSMPGNSAASPVGRAAKQKAEDLAWRRQNPEWCTEIESQHPEWAPLEGCHDAEDE